MRVDFSKGSVAHRLRFGGGRGQDLAKAMGLRGGKTPRIIDAISGLPFFGVSRCPAYLFVPPRWQGSR
ncbi:class I SAM-dependent methyltransferase [Sulfitobacter sp.]|uniref:class I SAM-dependent methyltransferase n=1 Tax=Sulfitobacter sp. TaxID=1903071 RepID=UPI003F6CD979